MKNGRVQRCYCKIRNNTQQYYYDVWIQFVLEIAEVDLDKIKVAEVPSSVQSYSFLKDGDFIPTGGSGRNADGQPTRWKLLHEIAPGAEHNFNIEIDHPELLCSISHVLCHVKILHFSTSPVTIVSEGDGQIQVPFTSKGHELDSYEIESKGTISRGVIEATDQDNSQVAMQTVSNYGVLFAVHTSTRTLHGRKHSVASVATLTMITSQSIATRQCSTQLDMGIFGNPIHEMDLHGN